MSSSQTVDVYAVGNAIVDILAFVDDDFVASVGMSKGAMTLVDAEQQAKILEGLKNADIRSRSGGSAANSMIAIAQSGGSGIFAGKVAEDENGDLFDRDLNSTGILFESIRAGGSAEPTATSVILTTPDAERTMCTHLGASIQLSASDIDASKVSTTKIAYAEGYLWAQDNTRNAVVKTAEAIRDAGGRFAFTFSDAFLVDGFRSDFKYFAKASCDILFCNADEARSLWETSDLPIALEKMKSFESTVFVTDGKEGAWLVVGSEIFRVEGRPVDAIDTVGAGDAFAGGVLYGLSNGFSEITSARWGNFLASEVVQVRGPRLDVSLKKRISEFAD